MTRRLAIPLFLLAWLAAPVAPAQTKIASEKLADGIWAAPTPGGANVGWFVVGDAVVVVDAGSNEEVGRALVEEIQRTTGQKPRYVVITHAHRDHAGGAAAFAAAGAQILTSEKAASVVLTLLEAGSRTKNGEKAGAPKAVVMTVAERSLLVGNLARRAEIYDLGPAHTAADLAVLLPNDGVLFAGDLAVNGVLPFLRSDDIDLEGWKRTLIRLSEVKVDKMVPGHGKIGPRDGIADTAAYIRRVDEICARLVFGDVPEALYDGALHAPENMIQNVPITPDHVANVKAVCQLEKSRREKAAAAPAAAPTPAPKPQTP
ncbi:MAG: MBL fold metallo-hydrolase [Thermoanaerobaculia bacterium]